MRNSLTAAALALSATLTAFPAAAEPGPRWPVDTCRTNSSGYPWGPGDDNCDGVIEEHEAGWDCRTMGERICEPGNVRGFPPGDYNTMDVEGWVK